MTLVLTLGRQPLLQHSGGKGLRMSLVRSSLGTGWGSSGKLR